CYLLLFMRTITSHLSFFSFFNDTATTYIYTLSLHDALPIFLRCLDSGQEFAIKLRVLLEIIHGHLGAVPGDDRVGDLAERRVRFCQAVGNLDATATVVRIEEREILT